MTVEELIKELQKMPQNLPVAAGTDDTAEYFVSSVRSRDNVVVIIDATEGDEVL